MTVHMWALFSDDQLFVVLLTGFVVNDLALLQLVVSIIASAYDKGCIPEASQRQGSEWCRNRSGLGLLKLFIEPIEDRELLLLTCPSYLRQKPDGGRLFRRDILRTLVAAGA